MLITQLNGIPVSNVVALSACQLTNVSPHNASNGSDTGFSFIVTDSSDAIAWIKVSSPSQNLVLDNAASDWLPNITVASYSATYSGNPISPGNNIEVDAGGNVSYFPPSNWTVQASTDPSGSNPITCSGDTSIFVTDTTPPEITDVTADVSTTSAVVAWSTDKSTTGEVIYGPTASYGNTVTDNAYATSHTLTLPNLSSDTNYYYHIQATDQSGNTTVSGDSTFLTSAATKIQATPPITATITPTVNSNDKTPPAISITSSLPKIASNAPTIIGIATDNLAVAKVEYSTDGGQNWLTVDTATGLGSKQVNFSFTPTNLDDGTYQIVARVVDGGGNTAATPPLQLVIDRIPPIVGGDIISVGSQVLEPDQQGVVHTMAGVGLDVHLSAIGGATSINLSATTLGSTAVPATFTLTRSNGSGLWAGTLSFTKSGNYQLVAHAVDGAGNTTVRTLNNIAVGDTGLVLSPNGPVADARVAAYYLDTDTNSWILWDGQPYGQTNPQQTDGHGNFRLLLPPGTYYVKVSKPGYQTLNSTSFVLKHPSPLSAILHPKPISGIGILYAPWLNFKVQPLQSNSSKNTTAFPASRLIGTTIRDINLTDTAGQQHTPVDWLGKPTVISVMSTWSPANAEQVAALNKLAQNQDINVVMVGLQEDAAQLRAYNAIAGYQLTWLADPDSQLSTVLDVGSLPTHYFVDRKGTIRNVVSEVLSVQQLADDLTTP